MRKKVKRSGTPTSLEFFGHLVWLDGRPLLDTIEPYRRRLFVSALDTFDKKGLPVFNFVLAGRAKKNNKSADLTFAAFYKLLIPSSPQGNSGFLVANDEDQAGDDLDLARKLVAANPNLAAELDCYNKEIRRRDGAGILKILPARDIAGLHGKTGNFIGFDEVHGYRNYDLFEALAPDPSRRDVLTWVTSYDTIFTQSDVPLFDFKQIGFAGTDPRMIFSWYSGDRCTDPEFADLPPEQRANPSMASWVDGERYLEQQKRRLPSHKYRRLHLNLPGAVNGAFFDQASVMACVDNGVRVRPYQAGISYVAAVDMSGGSNDDAVLAICHHDGSAAILDLVVKQAGGVPFDPRAAVQRFCGFLEQYGVKQVMGDRYGGLTFSYDFESAGIRYMPTSASASDAYHELEPRLNAGEIKLLDDPTLIEQLLTLVIKGGKVTHEAGSHDDFAAAAALALNHCARYGGGSRVYAASIGEGRQGRDFGDYLRDAAAGIEQSAPISYADTLLNERRRAVLGANWKEHLK